MHISFQNDPIQYVYILIGMRGVGKTTLGKHATSMISKGRFMDMDQCFSQQSGMTIADFVAQHGWPAFRRVEVQCMESVVQQITTASGSASPPPWIVSTGGGILEAEEGRALFDRLWDWNRTGPSSCKIFIVHLQRTNMDAFIQAMDDSRHDPGRPSLNEPLDSVWRRRKVHYHRYSHFDFYLSTDATLDTAHRMKASCQSFVAFIQRLAHRQSIRSTKQHYCLSITDPDSLSPAALNGIDMVEMRADALHIRRMGVPAALSHLRGKLGDSQLSILLTCRSKEQGGPSDWCPTEILSAQDSALRLGVEYIDIEVPTVLESSAFDMLIEQAIRCEAQVVLSYHELKAIGAGETWRLVYDQMQEIESKWHVPMILKLVSTWSQPGDLALWQQWWKDRLDCSHRSSATRRVITHLMGSNQEARCTRVQNSLTASIVFLTFDLNDNVAAVAATASGQYSVQSLHEAQIQVASRASCKNFYLFGFPVRSSPSPALHTAGFRALGLPSYQYSAVEAESFTGTELELIRSKDFGGASVTIPLKMTVSALVQKLQCPQERSIGALNTLIPDEEGSGQLIGANTDWMALYVCLLCRVRQVKLERLGKEEALVGKVHVLILGAGATSRSSLYAIQQLFGNGEREGDASVWIWNRTVSKAKALATEFHVHVLDTLHLDALFLSPPSIFILVNTLPPTAQAEVSWPTLPDGFKHSPMILADYSYLKGKETPFLAFYRHLGNNECSMITGPELLLEQALHQFHYWTGRRPPKSVMEEAMRQAIQ